MKNNRNSHIRDINLISNMRGAVLPQIIAVSAIVATLSVAVLSLTKNSSKVAKYIDQRSLEDQFKIDIYNTLRKKSSCEATFNGVNSAAGSTVNNILDTPSSHNGAAPTPILIASTVAPFLYGKNLAQQDEANNTSIQITQMALSNTALNAPYTENITGIQKATGSTILNIRYNRFGNFAATETSVSQLLRVPLQITTNNAGVIISCQTSNEYNNATNLPDGDPQNVSALCDRLQGDSTRDGYCRHTQFEDDAAPNNDYSATFKGRVLIEPSAVTNGSPNNDLKVDGTMAIGNLPVNGASNAGYLTVENSLTLGPDGVANQPSEAGAQEPGLAYINNSVGVGIAPNALKGTIHLGTNATIGSATAMPAGSGNLHTKTSLGVGIAANAQVGQVHISQALSVNKAPFPNTGSVRGTGLAVNTGNFEGNGNVNVNGYINLPNISNTHDASSGIGPKLVATMGWVSNKIAQTLTPSSVSAAIDVLQDIQNQSTPNSVGFLKVCNGFWMQNPNLVMNVQGQVSGLNRCEFLLRHCFHKNGATPYCNTLFAGANGIESDGAILAKSGAITAQTGNIVATVGNVIANSGSVIGGTVRANSRLSLNSCALTNWSDISIMTNFSNCQTLSSGGSCGSGRFAVRIDPVWDYFNYLTSATKTGGTSASKKFVGNVNVTCCEMQNYKCGAAASSPPSIGSCGSNSFTCNSGSVTSMSSDSLNDYWTCYFPAPGVSSSCTKPKNTDGQCNAPVNTCISGVMVDTADMVVGSTTVPTWECRGIGSGATDYCTANMPVDAECPYDSNGETHEQACAAGTLANLTSTSTYHKWDCLGINGGSNTDCTMYISACGTTYNTCNDGAASGGVSGASKWSWYCTGGATLCEKMKPVNAVCSSTHYGCSVGIFQTGSDSSNATTWTWTCDGQYGGSNASCSENKPIPGQCGASHYSCSKGTSVSQVNGATAWTWTCTGTYGGASANCSESKPAIPGQCGGSHYSCTQGTSTAQVSGATAWTWTCTGANGGSDASCSETKPVTCTNGDERWIGAGSCPDCGSFPKITCELNEIQECSGGTWVFKSCHRICIPDSSYSCP